MIRPRYALLLARTKLRSKRAMLWASIIVSSILFAALWAAICVFQGAYTTAAHVIESANDGHYLVTVSPVIPGDVNNFYSGGMNFTAKQVSELRAGEKEYYDAERARYAAAGVPYDASTEIPLLKPSIFADPDVPEDRRVMIDWSSPVADYLLNQRFQAYAKTAKNTLSDLKRIAGQYGATQYYSQRGSLVSPMPAQRLILNGKENLGDQYQSEATMMTADIHAIHNGLYSFIDDALLRRSMITTPSPLKGIPVVPSVQEVVKLFGAELGLSKEPRAGQTRTQWLAEVQQRASGYVYQSCYRNATEQQMLQKAQLDYATMKDHADDASYQKPSLLYALPESACGDITIASDTRTKAEKEATATFEANQKKLGEYQAPRHQRLTFQIVGLVYAEAYGSDPTNLNEFMRGLFIGSAGDMRGAAALIPRQLYTTLPEAQRFDNLAEEPVGRFASANSEDFADRIVAFSTVDDARQFIDTGCRRWSGSCDKLFYTDVYGSNYLLLDEMTTGFSRIFSIAFPVVLGLALVIIWFTVSRIMADNRKETAVYRAMGAKRGDIAAIYLTYIGLVAMRITLLAGLGGVVAAFIIDRIYSPIATDAVAGSYGAVAHLPAIQLFNLSSPLMWVVLVAIFAASFLASIQPLIRNVLRPPVEDMRSE